LQDFGEGKYDRKVINAVKTRAKKTAELKEAKREEESMREEQAGTKEVQSEVSKGGDLSCSGVEEGGEDLPAVEGEGEGRDKILGEEEDNLPVLDGRGK